MEFIKMQGTGNDYVYIDCFINQVTNAEELSIKMSHRHFGIGSDGLILIKPYPGADGEMEMYNPDGSRSEMCGNGLRCVAKFIHDHYARGKGELKLMTGAGWRSAKIFCNSKGEAENIKLNMGEPIFSGPKIPCSILSDEVFNQEIQIEGELYKFSSVSMGNPHCVIFVDDVAKFPVEKIGPQIEHHSLFPKRVNVEFVQIISPSEVIQRTWERGAGETWACGTGASAVAVVGKRLGLTAEKLLIHLTGGDLLLEYQGSGAVFMTGNAVEVFRGTWPSA